MRKCGEKKNKNVVCNKFVFISSLNSFLFFFCFECVLYFFKMPVRISSLLIYCIFVFFFHCILYYFFFHPATQVIPLSEIKNKDKNTTKSDKKNVKMNHKLQFFGIYTIFPSVSTLTWKLFISNEKIKEKIEH